MKMELQEIVFPGANLRDTYDTLHHVRQAQALSVGGGVRVGIIDWLFACDRYPALYAGWADISGEARLLHQADGHGRWMADTLKEIAPGCRIFAINGVLYDEERPEERIRCFEKAVDWAIDNGMDILTYSHPAFTGGERDRADRATQRAVEAGIITTFLHNDSPLNLFPYGCLPFPKEGYRRRPDIRIYHFDHNVLLLSIYQRYIEAGREAKSGNDLPYFSFSSMSVVLGGFAAMMKALRPTLTAGDCRDILQKTGYDIPAPGRKWYEPGCCTGVADIHQALLLLREKDGKG